MRKTLILGATVVDVILRLPRLPQSQESCNIYHQELRLGGCAFNASEALRRFGLPWFESRRGDGYRKALLREGDLPWAKAWLAALGARGTDIQAERETIRENCERLRLPKSLLKETER